MQAKAIIHWTNKSLTQNENIYARLFGGNVTSCLVTFCSMSFLLYVWSVVLYYFIGKLDIFHLISLNDIVSMQRSDSDSGKYRSM